HICPGEFMIFRWRRLAAAALLAPCVSVSALASDADANKLFVEAALMMRDQAQTATSVRRVVIYRQALASIDRIIHSYPDTNLAVALVSGQAVGDISRAGVVDRLRDAVQDVCSRDRTPGCVLSLADELNRAETDDSVLSFLQDAFDSLANPDEAL